MAGGCIRRAAGPPYNGGGGAILQRRRGAADARSSRRWCAPATATARWSCTNAPWRSPSGRAAGEPEAPDELAELVAGLSVAEADVLIRSLTRWFQLVNLAEDNERVRRLRARGDDNPGSVRHAVGRCKTRGVSAEELTDTLAAAGAAARAHRAPDRGPAAHHDREARPHLRHAARARRAGHRRGRGVRAPGGDRAGAVGLRRRAHGRAERGRRGPGRPRLPLHHARAHHPRRLPRAGGRDRRGLPRRVRPDPAAAHVRLVDGRRPRRQPERDAEGDGRRAGRDARAPASASSRRGSASSAGGCRCRAA